MNGTKLAACHQKMADCDDLQVCSKLVLNFENHCSMPWKQLWKVRPYHYTCVVETAYIS